MSLSLGTLSPASAAASEAPRSPDRPKTGLLSREERVESRLRALLPNEGAEPELLVTAVRDACLGSGKRVRPVLAMMSSAHFGGDELAAVDFGCALEFIHAASLVLDDLPCMDNAALRRGRPTLHRRLGEDAAVLAAVALLNHAYAVIGADHGLDADIRLALQAEVSAAVGFGGLVAGQIRDLHESSILRDEAGLTRLNRQKTSVLFVAAAVGGALIAGADGAARARARGFADKLGLAFQLWDDLQDCTSSEEVMGKDARQDEGRVTFVTLWGEERTRAAVAETLERALAELGEACGPLGEYTLNLFRAAGYGG